MIPKKLFLSQKARAMSLSAGWTVYFTQADGYYQMNPREYKSKDTVQSTMLLIREAKTTATLQRRKVFQTSGPRSRREHDAATGGRHTQGHGSNRSGTPDELIGRQPEAYAMTLYNLGLVSSEVLMTNCGVGTG